MMPIVKILFKYYCSHVDPSDPKKDFIVLEDLRKQGYRLAKEKVFLDFEHCAAALKTIAKFHALSYMQKAKDSSKLFSNADKIQDKWTPDHLKLCQGMIKSCAERGIQPVIDQGESVELLQSLLHEFEDVPTFFRKLVTPVEPEAVICHGDFNRNNILFKYNETQQVIGVKLIDLQTPRYSSPAIDLCFLMFMNMSHSLRTKNLNGLLDIYYRSLLSTVGNSLLIPEVDLSRSAIFGFIISSFFLPVMMAGKISIEEALGDGPNSGIGFASKRGGLKETQAIVDNVKDMIKFGYIRKNYY